jgi:SAM-dependent methyltransferase
MLVPMHLETVEIQGREDRSQFIARRFGPILRGRLLDVGCDRAHLRRLIPSLDYVGIDIGGEPDRVVNLERERIPFPDASFDAVVCSDVLEHLDNLHVNFGELMRVCRGHAVISLPNNWANARRRIERGHGQIGYYGLPAEAPEDRHKWFFGFSEAADFFQAQTSRYPFELTELFGIEKPRLGLLRWGRRLRYSTEAYANRYAHSVWAVFRRR